MERAQVSSWEHLKAAREALGWTQEHLAEEVGVDRTTIQRWERGAVFPSLDCLKRLCIALGKTAAELGIGSEEEGEEDDRAYQRLCSSSLAVRLLRCLWQFPRNARYHKLQAIITLELEDNTMKETPMSRREALAVLITQSVEVYRLSAKKPAVIRSPGDRDELLLHIASGITACWYLRRGKDLAEAADVLNKYIPTLKEIAQHGNAAQCLDALELLTQCALLNTALSWGIATDAEAIRHATIAVNYAEAAKSPILQSLALRVQAAACHYAGQWKQALQLGEDSYAILKKVHEAPPLLQSYVYAGLATYQSYLGQKQEAITSLRKAHQAFPHSDDPQPIWVDHNIGNLLLNDGDAYWHLGLYKEAISALEQVNHDYAQDASISLSCRTETLTTQVRAELLRTDQPRDMERCINLLTRNVESAKVLQSTRKLGRASQAYQIMQAVWPGERRIADLRDLLMG